MHAVLDVGCSTRNLQFRPVGQSTGAAVGVVITGIDRDPPLHWLAYVKVADRVFVPQSSQFYPAVAESELANLLSSESIADFVWHPATGLIAFEQHQILRTADLLSIPPARETNWDCADPGQAVRHRLVSVVPDAPLTPEIVFESGRDDIGTDADDISTAPRSSDESSVITDLLATTLRPFAQAADWLARHAPAGASTPTWVNAVGDWAAQVLQNTGISQSKRMNELRRLMSMLDNDPDRGLRYALPFGGDAARGIAQGSNKLIGHGVEYGSGRGSGAADYWDMPYHVRAALIAKYRELAQREVSLGRYPRAAYIYAMLLDDHASAAQVLMDGGYYREAAEVYRSKLKQARKAAECLLKGGLWSEAVEIYTELADWPAVAGVYEKLEERDAAKEAWQKACDTYAAAGNYIQAARVQERQLMDNAAAEKLLEHGWNHSTTAQDCLTELFDLFARTENHSESHVWVEQLATDERLPIRQQCDVASLFADLSHRYPNADLRAAAFENSRQIVARRMPHATDGDRRQFLSVLEKLVPDDKLLGRDCRRYIDDQTSVRTRSRSSRVALLDQLQLRADVAWETAVRSGSQIFVAGFSGESLVVAFWKQERKPTVHYHTYYVRQERQSRILLAPAVGRSGQVILHLSQFCDADILDSGLQKEDRHIQPLPYFDENVIAVGTGKNGTIWIIRVGNDGIEIRGNLEPGSPINRRTLPVDCSSMQPDAFIKPFRADTIACVVENTLVVVSPMHRTGAEMNHPDRFVADTASMNTDSGQGVGVDQFTLPKHVHDVSTFENSGGPRMAVTFDEGGLVHWISSGQQKAFGLELFDPVSQFMANEDLVVADRAGAIEIYKSRNNSLALKASHSVPGVAAVAILSVAHTSYEYATEFVLVRSDGSVYIMGYHG